MMTISKSPELYTMEVQYLLSANKTNYTRVDN